MKRWNPEPQLAVARPRAMARARSWPAGALPGLVLVAIGCFGIAAGAYEVLGPTDSFAADETVDLKAFDQAVGRS